MKNTKTVAIVLRRTNYGEADRIIQFITPEGKISAIAKGARREKSRLAGGIELFSICEIVFIDSKSEMKTITSSRLVKFYNQILENYEKMQFAYSAIKLISKSSESSGDKDWYDLLSGTLAGLNSKALFIEIVQSWFYIRYAFLTGHDLSFSFDINGNKIVADFNYFYDIDERGFRPDISGNLKSDHIKLLRLISTKNLDILAKIGGTESLLADCLAVAREHAAI